MRNQIAEKSSRCRGDVLRRQFVRSEEFIAKAMQAGTIINIETGCQQVNGKF